ncbi:MAG: DsrE family protein [Chryseolinea sp.]
MKILFILNDAPYGSDKNYNALRTALQFQKQYPDAKIWIYLMRDSVTGALSGQKEKASQYSIGDMLTNIILHGGEVKLCTSCAETRGVNTIIEGAVLGTLPDLTKWIAESDKALNF